MTAPLIPDLVQTREYLKALTGEDGPTVTFQTFDDNEKRKARSRAFVLHGKLGDHAVHLARLNNRRAGVFVMVNAGDLKGRKTENVVAVRAAFSDFDSKRTRPYALSPSFIVHTSPGKEHGYFTTGMPLADFKPTQKALAAYYGSDPDVNDLPRVMRLPGFYHRKKEPFLVMFEPGSGRTYTLDEIRAAHPVEPKKPAPAKPKTTSPKPATGTRREKLMQIVREKAEGRSWTEGNRHASAKETAAHGRKLGLEAGDLLAVVAPLLEQSGKTFAEAEDIVTWTMANVEPDPDEAERPAMPKAEAPATAPAATQAPSEIPNVDGAELLDEVSAFVRAYVVMTEEQTTVTALWVAHAHALEAFDMTPYLAVMSPEKVCGKSLLLDVLELLVPRPWLAVNVSEAVLFRKIHAEKPTLMIDEIDNLFSKSGEATAGLLGLLNAGWQRGRVASRCSDKGGRLENFEVFCPKVLAGIGELPGALPSRALPLALKRKTREDGVKKFRRREAEPVATELRARVAAWAEKMVSTLRDARPVIPDELEGRQADTLEPLLSCADAVGGSWPAEARRAGVALLVADAEKIQTPQPGALLLADLKEILADDVRSDFPSAVLIEKLVRIEESPWSRWHHGDPLSPVALGKLLAPYGIKSHPVRQDGKVLRRYARWDFEDAIRRYVLQKEPATKPEPATEPATPAQPFLIPPGKNPLPATNAEKPLPERPEGVAGSEKQSRYNPATAEDAVDVAGVAGVAGNGGDRDTREADIPLRRVLP